MVNEKNNIFKKEFNGEFKSKQLNVALLEAINFLNKDIEKEMAFLLLKHNNEFLFNQKNLSFKKNRFIR